MKWYENLFVLWYGIGALISIITVNLKFFIVWVSSIVTICIICETLLLGGIL